jgi:RNA polymerase sigma-70 factor (ECF subfamily)
MDSRQRRRGAEEGEGPEGEASPLAPLADPDASGGQRSRARLRAGASDVIAGARAGAEKAYEELLAAYGPRLYGYFFRATGSHHDAEDLLGELMLRLVRSLPGYDDRGRFEPWLFSIAANLVRDRIRRVRTSLPATSLEAEGSGGATLAETLGAEQEAVEASLVRDEQSEILADALEKIDERSRQLLLLRHFGQLSFREIAEIFNCPIGTVLARVHRALKALRAAFEQDDESD